MLSTVVLSNENQTCRGMGSSNLYRWGRMSRKELIPGYLNSITGEYATPVGYFVDEKETEEFDKLFPYKEKKKLPGQLF